jgi:DNA-binding Lrp family transcriptional regulator
MTAQCVLHTFFGGVLSLINKGGSLTAGQVAALRPAPAARPPGQPLDRPGRISAEDRPLLATLEMDGRTTFSDLAAATGWAQTTVRRRIADLRASGTLYFDVDFHQSLLDLTVRAVLWLSVSPAQLSAAGEALAGHPETAYVAATTGPANLYASVLSADTEALYEYLTTRIALLPGVNQVESIPVMRTIKRSGLLTAPERPVLAPGRKAGPQAPEWLRTDAAKLRPGATPGPGPGERPVLSAGTTAGYGEALVTAGGAPHLILAPRRPARSLAQASPDHAHMPQRQPSRHTRAPACHPTRHTTRPPHPPSACSRPYATQKWSR